MLCPKCQKEMIAVERNDVELDYCMFCNGFWFDNNEWNILCKKLIVGSFLDDATDIYSLPQVLSKEEIRRCPICGEKMEKFMLSGIMLDRCSYKHGIWFDKDEFSACVNAVQKDFTYGEQIKFLGEVFNR